MNVIRLLIDLPAPGAWNMAVDEVLLDTAAASGQATLRFYGWSEPTLSLGYFQAAADRAQHATSLTCALVRRASGGGAILHDRELTYSISLPVNGAGRGAASDLYTLVHESLLSALATLGVTADIHRTATFCRSDPAPPSAPVPFLCFQRRACGDIVCAGGKIVGSAQRRHKRAVLQHGSVLLGRSVSAPELPGIAELQSAAIDLQQLVHTSAALISSRLGLALQRGTLSPAEQRQATEIEKSRFAAGTYVYRR